MADNISAVLKDISKQFGDGIARIMSDTEDLDIERVSSGSLNLDLALGGGFPKARTIEVYGPESGGKTTIALLHAAATQKKYPDKYVFFSDIEHSLDPSLLTAYDIDETHFIISQPDTAEQALDSVEAFIRSGLCSLVIIDSVSALVPSAEAEEDMSKQTIGLQARLMSKAMRKLTPVSSKFDCTIIFINQIREKVGVMFGSPETTSGGRALNFYASIRVSVRPGEPINGPGGKDDRIGHIINARVVKNKTAKPYKLASFPLMYGIGVDTVFEVVDIALNAGLLTRAGSWIRILDAEGKPLVRNTEAGEVTLNFQSKDKFTEYVRSDTAMYNLLEHAIRGKIITIEEYAGTVVE